MVVKANWQNGEQFSAADANAVGEAVNSAYALPVDGVPIADLAAAVQLSLGRADSAVQAVDADSISDSTTTGRAVLTAVDAAAARSALGVAYGSTSGTVVQGDDSRLSPAAAAISDATTVGRAVLTAADASAARTTLGVAYGTTSTSVAVGDDSRITGAQQASEKGQAGGFASLDSNGKVPGSQLPNSIMTYEGLHDVSTNTPTLSDASGDAGQVYRVSVAGTRNYGSGSIELGVGDYLIHSATEWQKADTTDAVASVAGRTGNIVLTAADVDGAVATGSAATLASVQAFNTADATNFERGRIHWSSNAFTVSADQGGTGVARDAVVSSGTSSVVVRPGGNFGRVFLTGSSASGTGGSVQVSGTLNASSGTQFSCNIVPTISESGTAGYTALLINPTESSTGSGTKRLIDAQVGGTSRFSVDNTGNMNCASYTESVVAIGTVGAANTLSLVNGTVLTATLTASTATTFTMPAVVAGKSFVLMLRQAATTGNGTATFTNVKWTGTAPVVTATAGRMDIFSFFSDGTNWYGSVAAGYTP